MNSRALLGLACACLSLASCSMSTQEVPRLDIERSISAVDLKNPQVMEIFFDGTKNDWADRTNVRRRFEVVSVHEDPTWSSFYVDGVGNDYAIYAMLGIGMKSRVVEAYKHLAYQRYDPRAKIRIYGFSRGSLQARMLAGMIAYTGLPVSRTKFNEPRALSKKDVDKIANILWDFSREHQKDSDNSSSDWNGFLASERARAQAEVRRHFPGRRIEFDAPQIEFLGIWDTVPGLFFTKFNLEGNGLSRTRYKIKPYPNIKVIAHAMSIDERRKRFQPLLVGPPLDPNKTKVHEVWFPGVHSDVGGGYDDSNDISGVTFNWMHRLMKDYGISSKEYKVYHDPTSILHRSETEGAMVLTKQQTRYIPVNAVIHPSLFQRLKSYPLPERKGFRSRYVNSVYSPTLYLADKRPIQLTPGMTPEDLVKASGGALKVEDSTKPAAVRALKGKPLTDEQIQVEIAPVIFPATSDE